MAEASQFAETRRRFFPGGIFDYDALDGLLGNLQDEFGMQACVAGGWIRDCALTAKPHDIDVFFEAWEADDVLVSLEQIPSRVDGEPNPDYNWAGNLVGQSMREMDFMGETWPVNLIFLDPSRTVSGITGMQGYWVDHVIRSFDIGMCQVGYSINTGMRCTVAFDEALRFKQITVNPNVTHYHIDTRVAKMSLKYPTWALPTKEELRATPQAE